MAPFPVFGPSSASILRAAGFAPMLCRRAPPQCHRQQCAVVTVVSQRTATSAASSAADGPKSPPPANNGGASVGLLKRYEQWLQGSYPTMYKLHRLTVDGSKWCYADLKTYFWLAYGLRKGRITLHDLNAHELFVYIQAGAQLTRLSLLAVVAVLPAGFPLILISMLVSPKLVLTRHFWTDWQSQQFQMEDLRRNGRKLFPPIVDALRPHNSPSSAQALSPSPLDQLPLTIEQLVTQKAVNIPASLDALTWQHLFQLKRMNKLPFWASDIALLRHINLLQLLDRRMAERVQENVDKLSVRELQTHLHLRSLDFSRMTVAQMRSALVQWLNHFKGPSSIGPLLYAHVPVLTQANSNDLERWKRGRTVDGQKTTKEGVMPTLFVRLPDNLEERKQQLVRQSVELANAVKPMLRKGTQMVTERLKEAGKAVKKSAN